MKFAPILALVASTLFSLAAVEAKDYHEATKYSDKNGFSLRGHAGLPKRESRHQAVGGIVST